MKANAPEKIYLLKSQNRILDGWYNKQPNPKTFEQVEYTRTDAFIKKAKKWFERYTEWRDLEGNRHYDMKSFEDFVNYMEGE